MPEKPTLAGPVYDWLMGGQRKPAPENVLHVTELVGPAPIAVLKREHHHQITPEPQQNFNLALGTACHDAIQRSAEAGAPAGSLIERPLEQAVEVDGVEWLIRGTPDYWHPDSDETPDAGHLWDWKTSTQYKLVLKDYEDWTSQLSVYTWMLDKVMGKSVLTAQVQALLKDWTISGAKRNANNPQHQIDHIPITLWTLDETEAWLAGRIRLFADYRTKYRSGAVDSACSEKDRWNRNIRCEHYCFARPFCPMWIK